MNIRDLKYLVALAEHKHFGKAAKACFVSQPALSMQIKKLEEVLSVQLLERTNKSVLLTEIGTVLAERARQLLQQADEIQEIAKLSNDPYAGEFKLGIIPTLAPYLLPYIIPQLSEYFPKLKLYLVEEQTAVLVDKLSQGIINAAMLVMPLTESNFVATPLFEEEFLLAVPESHEFSNKKMIRQKELQNKTLLLLKEGHCLREQSLALCYKVKANENNNFRATSLETLRHMVAAGVGITLIPKLAYRQDDNIAYIKFDEPKPMRTLGMFWRASTAKQHLLQDITRQIKKIMQKQKNITVVD